MKPLYILLAGTLILAAACQSAQDTSDENAQPLNVLFIAVDDLRPELGCYGKEYILSPHIDRLAREGLLFERAYCQQAVCSPSRTSLLTGLRPDATHVYDLETHFRNTVPDVVTLPQYFKENGYHTEWWGKIFHANLLDTLSWTRQGSKMESNRGYITEDNLRLAETHKGRGLPYEKADVPDNAYPDGKIADSAIVAINRLKDQPFFLAVGFYKPHLPFNAPQKYWELYDPAAIQLPEQTKPPQNTPEIALSNWGELRNYVTVPKQGPVSDTMARQLIHGYRACVSYTDAQVGRLLDELDRLDLRKNTLVILWGDHGWKLGEYGDWCKHTNFELDTHAPLIVSTLAMQAAGKTTPALVEFVDIYPSLCEAAGLALPGHLQGKSFMPLLDDPQQAWKTVALSQYPRRGGKAMGYSMRTDRYRFTKWQSLENAPENTGETLALELYDHNQSEDIAQTNLAGQPQYATVVEELDSLLEVQWKVSLSE